jgi:fatty acid kinase fatty acid binding subunit
MSRIGVVTDSASDLEPDEAAEHGIIVVPLYVAFGERDYRAGVDLTSKDFWRELTAAGAAFPKTAAAPPGAFREAFERHFADGAQDIVYVGIAGKLSATVQSARVARDGMSVEKQAHIHIVDSDTASMGVTLLAVMAVDLAARGMAAADIVAELERRRADVKLYVALETLEYLKRGGRISPARAAIGNVLSVKPIITIEDGIVETADRPRTRARARERLLELLSAQKLEQVWLLHGEASGMNEFADDLAKATRFPREKMTTHLIGPSVGPHVGPGAYGAVILKARPGH